MLAFLTYRSVHNAIDLTKKENADRQEKINKAAEAEEHKTKSAPNQVEMEEMLLCAISDVYTINHECLEEREVIEAPEIL